MTPTHPPRRNGPHWSPASWLDQRNTTERLQQARRDREVPRQSAIGFREERE